MSSAHEHHGLFWRMREFFQPIRQSSPDCEQEERTTDGMSRIEYPLHQPPPKPHVPFAGHPVTQEWLKEQKVLHQRVIVPTETGPSLTKEMLPGHVLQIVREVVPYQPPLAGRRQNTEGISQQVSMPLTPIPATPAAPRRIVHTGRLVADERPVDDIATSPLTPRKMPTRDELPAYDLLATLPPERFLPERDELGVAELPTWISPEQQDRAVVDVLGRLPSWLTDDPPGADWIGGVLPSNGAIIQYWTMEDDPPPVLHELPSDALSVADRTAGTGEPAEIRAALFADVRQPSRPLDDDAPTEMTERARADKGFKQAISGLLESE